MEANLSQPEEIVELSDSLKEAIRIIHRHLAMVISVTGVVFLGIGVITFRTPPKFRSTALISVGSQEETTLAAIGSGWRMIPLREASAYANAQAQLISGRTIGERVVRRIGPGSFVARVGPSLSSTIRRNIASLLGSKPESISVFENAVRVYLKNISVRYDRDSALLAVSYSDSDPRFTAKVVNTAIEVYKEYVREMGTETTSQTFEKLQRWVDDLRAEREKIKQQLLKLSESGKWTDATERALLEPLMELSRALSSVQISKASIQAQCEAFRSILESKDGVPLDSLPEVASDPLIQKIKQDELELKVQISSLLQRYGPDHPDIKTLQSQLSVIENIKTNLMKNVSEIQYQSLIHQLNAISQQEALLKARVRGEEELWRQRSRKRSQVEWLANDAKAIEDLYNAAVQKLKELELGKDSDIGVSRVQIYERAVEGKKVGPKTALNLILGLLLGLVAGVGLAFLYEYIDDSVKDPEILQSYVGVPLLGVVPIIGDKKTEPRDKDLFTHRKPRSSIAESFRAVRTSVSLSAPDGEIRRLLVTSALPQEGKTTTAIGTAIAFAQQGLKVIIVDADMRNPRIHTTFGIDPDAGLSNILAGQTEIDETVQETEVPNLSVIPCGPPPPNPAELLGTERATQVFEELGERFDLLVIDSPPVIAVTDPVVLAGKVDAVALVVLAGKTSRRSARHSVELLSQSRSRIIGAILNEIRRVHSVYDYGYGYGYRGYRYGYYKPQDEEEDD